MLTPRSTVSYRRESVFSILKFKQLGEILTKLENILTQTGSNDEKNGRSKISLDTPFKVTNSFRNFAKKREMLKINALADSNSCEGVCQERDRERNGEKIHKNSSLCTLCEMVLKFCFEKDLIKNYNDSCKTFKNDLFGFCLHGSLWDIFYEVEHTV